MAESSTNGAATIVMPKLGLTMTEGTIREWCVRPGVAVHKGDVLFVVESDKASNEIEAEDAGEILELLAAEGETLAVGAPVALWTGLSSGSGDTSRGGTAPAGNQIAGQETARPVPVAAQPVHADQPVRSTRFYSTPFARRLAVQGGLDITNIAGTGPRGRVQAADVRLALSDARTTTARAPAETSSTHDLPDALAPDGEAGALHYHVTVDVQCSAILAARQELKAALGTFAQVGLTAFIVLAAARALDEVPGAKVLWSKGALRHPERTGIGVAVNTPQGVFAPVVPVVGSLGALSATLAEAIARARNGCMTAEDADEAVMSIANVGMFNVRTLAPIVGAGQTYALGVGCIRDSWTRGDDNVPVPTPIVTLTLACNHRAANGAIAAQLLYRIAELLEHPVLLMAGAPVPWAGTKLCS